MQVFLKFEINFLCALVIYYSSLYIQMFFLNYWIVYLCSVVRSDYSCVV